MYRQGDLLFVKVDSLPKRFRRVDSDVVHRGEASGHSHRLIGGRIYRNYWNTEETFIVVDSVGKVVHEEHGEIILEKGVWMVVRQREYSPQTGFEYVIE
jgi:hypothetical protein